MKGDALGLVRLDLRHNELGDEGAIELGAALADEGSRLQHLDLRYSSAFINRFIINLFMVVRLTFERPVVPKSVCTYVQP